MKISEILNNFLAFVRVPALVKSCKNNRSPLVSNYRYFTLPVPLFCMTNENPEYTSNGATSLGVTTYVSVKKNKLEPK